MSTEKAIEKAQKEFSDSSFRKVKDSLRGMKGSREALEKAIARKKAKNDTSVAQEKAELEKVLAAGKQTRKALKGSPPGLSKSLTTLQDDFEATRKTMVASSEKSARLEQAKDQALFEWLDRMMEVSVQALDDPNAFELAKNILAGGIIVGGLYPPAAIGAAIASGIIVLRDTIEAADPRKRNNKFAARQKQLDNAVELMKAVTALSDKCAKTLGRP